MAIRPQAAAAIATPFVHEHGDAFSGQGFGEGLIVACGDAQCRQPQQAGCRLLGYMAQQLELVSVGAGDGHSRCSVHAVRAAPK
jgi:hypothetical protein